MSRSARATRSASASPECRVTVPTLTDSGSRCPCHGTGSRHGIGELERRLGECRDLDLRERERHTLPGLECVLEDG